MVKTDDDLQNKYLELLISQNKEEKEIKKKKTIKKKKKTK